MENTYYTYMYSHITLSLSSKHIIYFIIMHICTYSFSNTILPNSQKIKEITEITLRSSQETMFSPFSIFNKICEAELHSTTEDPADLA